MRHGLLAGFGLVFGVTAALATGCEGESKLTVVVEEGAASGWPSI